MERGFFLFRVCILLSLILPYNIVSGQDSLEVVILSKQDSIEINRLKKQGRDYYDIGDFDAAELSFDSIFYIDPNSILARNNLGLLYKLLGRYNDALRIYFEAESIVKRDFGATDTRVADLYINIGVIYNTKQDYELALQYLNFANKIYTDAEKKAYPANTVHSNRGNTYYGMQEWRMALHYYKLGIQAKIATDSSGLDVAYANCASIYEQLGELDSASIYYNYSINEKKAKYGKNSLYLIPTYTNYGVLLVSMGEMSEALEFLTSALDLADSTYADKHPDLANCYLGMAIWYFQDGEVDKALEYYQKGIAAVVFDFDNADIYSNPGLNNEIISEADLLRILQDKAEALDKKYNITGEERALYSALETLELANSLAEKMRSSYLSEGSKLLITGYARKGFDHSIRTAYELYRQTGDVTFANKAFISAEKSKSSVLLASLQDIERKKNLAIPADIQDFEHNLKQETDFYKKKIYEESQRSEPDQYRVEEWEQKLFYLSQQLDSIDDVIRERFPEYAAKFDNEVISLDGVMQGLKADEALIEYSLNDSCLYVFYLCPDNFQVNKIHIDSVFHNQVQILSQFLRNNDFASNTFDDYESYTQAAYYIYSILLEPLETATEGKRLLIIPDSELGYIPFEALLTGAPGGGGMDYRSLPYLIYRNRINYSYSATLYFKEDADRKKAEKTLLAFAPTYENIGDIKSDKFPSFRQYSTYLVPLRFISTEIRNISEIMEADLFEGYNATEEIFKANASDYNILHLAMHTLLNDENPLYSQLVFTLNNDTLEDNDGLLNAYEIFNMELNARMAVLSACNTGYGKLQRGEGIMSMARGFIFAGVPSIIMTLWAVEDQSGSILMSKFYNNLVEGMEIDEALREAKLQYLREADQLSAHPYLWSGYVSIGSTDALISSSGGLIFQISGAAVTIFILLLAILIRRKRKKKA